MLGRTDFKLVFKLVRDNALCPVPGGDQTDEAQVLQLGGGHEPERGEKPEKALPRQRSQAEGGEQ